MAVSVGLAIFLVFSNVAILPAVIYAHILHLIAETALLVAVFAASTAFHMCQVEWFCFGVELRELQIVDHFMVYTALVWFSLYFCGVAERPRTGITVVLFPVLLVVIIHFLGSMMDGAIVVAITVAFAFAALTYAFFVYGGIPIEWSAFVVATSLLGMGVFLHIFGGDYGDDNIFYPIAHSVWHILSMLSLFWILGIPYRDRNSLDTMNFGAGMALPVGKSVGAAMAQPPASVSPRQQQHTAVAAAATGTASPSRGGRSMREGGRISLGLNPSNIAII